MHIIYKECTVSAVWLSEAEGIPPACRTPKCVRDEQCIQTPSTGLFAANEPLLLVVFSCFGLFFSFPNPVTLNWANSPVNFSGSCRGRFNTNHI